MTDISRYKNISLDLKTYNLLKEQSKKICGVDLSLSQTVRHHTSVIQRIIDSPEFVPHKMWNVKLLSGLLSIENNSKEKKHANSN
jgi:hypothetical protein